MGDRTPPGRADRNLGKADALKPSVRRRTLIGVAVALTGILAPAPAHASKSQYTFFEAPREMGSDDTFLRQSALDEIAGFGVRQQRVLLNWNVALRQPNRRTKPADLAERDPSSAGYTWTRYDAIIAEAEQRGIRVMFTITGASPRWANARRRANSYKPSAKAFGRFVEAVGRRYGSRVTQWSIWNEPNQPQFLNPQFAKGKPYSPRLYRRLYRAAVSGLEASGNGDDQILAGETSPRGNDNIVAPLAFLRGFFRGGRLRVDGYAHHPYTTKAGPFFVPRNRKDVTIGVLSRLTRALDRYSKHRRLGVYLTEFGTQSRPDPFIGVSLQQQQEFRAIAERIAYKNPRVKAFSQYLLRDDVPRKGPRTSRYGGFESGVRTSRGKQKPAYAGFRLPLVLDRYTTRRMRVWSLVRPSIGTPTRVTIQYRMKKRRGSRKWRTFLRGTTNARGYFEKSAARYKAYREYRVVWTAADGTTFRGPVTRVYRAP